MRNSKQSALFSVLFEDIFKLTLLFVFNVLSGLVGKQ